MTLLILSLIVKLAIALPHILFVGKATSIGLANIMLMGGGSQGRAGFAGNGGGRVGTTGLPMATNAGFSAGDLVSAMQQIGTLTLPAGGWTVPQFMSQTYTVVSAVNGAATSFTMYAFNEDYLNATATNNGAGGIGGGAVTRTYTDGSTAGGTAFNGALISRVCAAYENNKGKICYGFDIDYSNTAGELPSALGTANIQVNYFNGDASTNPLKIDITTAKRNNRFISGELTILKKFNVSRFAQWTGFMPAATASTITAAVIFYFQPQPGQTQGMN